MTTWGHPSPCCIKKLKHRAARDLLLFHGEGWRADLSPISHAAPELGPKQYCLHVTPQHGPFVSMVLVLLSGFHFTLRGSGSGNAC